MAATPILHNPTPAAATLLIHSPFIFSTTHLAVPTDTDPYMPSIIVVPLFQQAHPPFLHSLPSQCRTRSRIYMSCASKRPSSFIVSSTILRAAPSRP
ncbi:unnamed protein product [Prunus brigantina]